MNTKYLGCLFSLILLLTCTQLQADDLDSLLTQPRWGIDMKIDYSVIVAHAQSPNDRVELSNTPIRAGFFYENPKFRVRIATNFSALDLCLALKRPSGFFYEICYQVEDLSTDDTGAGYYSQLNGDYLYNYSYGNQAELDTDTPHHFLTFSYGKDFYPWRQFRATPQLSVQCYGFGKLSNENTSYDYYSENKLLLIHQKAKTDLSFAFGGQLTLSTIPTPLLNTNCCCSFYSSLGVYYTPKMNFKRSVTVHEWVDDNTVYYESTARYNYYAETTRFVLGMRLSF
jgi:hypothetical protein